MDRETLFPSSSWIANPAILTGECDLMADGRSERRALGRLTRHGQFGI